MSWLSRIFSTGLPVVVEDEKIIVPSFEIPLTDAPVLEGTIAVEVENKVVKVALKKKPVGKVIKKVAAKKAAKKR